MEVATLVAVGDLEDIRVLVNRLEIHMRSLVENVDFALGDEEAVKFGIEEMKKKLGEFMRSVDRLGKQKASKLVGGEGRGEACWV
ncbi:uncharacterized protein A4U43_C03F24850 [Asparagus officinalis]|uniref:Rx N-terminal domain-containing protein n=1 Tax=Asparagus officinalis TaxID=4686 RepID=A0A5P1FCQ3_ASPOF|nr:uncharacterized protein A4U43_C03F24850 [Asparagus officinalis]